MGLSVQQADLAHIAQKVKTNILAQMSGNFEIYPHPFREMLTFKGVPFFPKVPQTEIKLQELKTLYLEYALYGGIPRLCFQLSWIEKRNISNKSSILSFAKIFAIWPKSRMYSGSTGYWRCWHRNVVTFSTLPN